MGLHLFAGLRVRDLAAARPWYEQLLGEPAFFPHATEAVWTLAEDRSVYAVEEPERAGQGVVTLFVDDRVGVVPHPHHALVEPDRLVAQLAHGAQRVGDEHEVALGDGDLLVARRDQRGVALTRKTSAHPRSRSRCRPGPGR